MGIDTQNKRKSIALIPPGGDGAVSMGDRRHINWLYRQTAFYSYDTKVALSLDTAEINLTADVPEIGIEIETLSINLRVES